MVDFSHMEIQPTGEALAIYVAEWLIDAVARTQGAFRLAVSGGSTPKALFALLAEPGNAARMNWQRLHLFWGDERFVPYDSTDSNYGECRRILLDHVPIPSSNVHPMPVDGAPDDAARRYEATLKQAYGADALDDDRPLFDVNMLGLGEDGHTASLIPGQPVLLERDRWVAAVGEGRPEVRLTLTYPALESATTVAFLVAGAGKAEIVNRLRAGANVPAAHLQPRHGCIWFMDQAAAD